VGELLDQRPVDLQDQLKLMVPGHLVLRVLQSMMELRMELMVDSVNPLQGMDHLVLLRDMVVLVDRQGQMGLQEGHHACPEQPSQFLVAGAGV